MIHTALLRRPGAAALALAAAAALAACGGGGGGGGAVTMVPSRTRVFFHATPFSDPAVATKAIEVRGASGALERPSAAVSHVSGAGGWLAVDVTGTRAPWSVGLTVASAALDAGTYVARVTLTAPGAAETSIEVTLAVEDPPSARTVTGRVTYDLVPATFTVATGAGGLDFAGAQALPVRGAVVRVAYDGAALDASTTTDGNGEYALTFTPPASVGLAIQVFAQTAAPEIAVKDNTDGNALWGMFRDVATSGPTDLHAGHGWVGGGYDPGRRIAAPFAILDAMYGAATAFEAVRPEPAFEPLTVYWSPDNQPSATFSPGSGLIGTSSYRPGQNAIYVLGKQGVDTDEFDRHVVVHEWAHYFEDTRSRADTIGGPHGAGDVLDPRVAWSEGYGNALAAILLDDTVYADTFWQDGALRAFGFDAETAPPPSAGSGSNPADDPIPSAFSETTVLRLLYDLWDEGSGEAFDGVSLGLADLHDVLTDHQKATPALTTAASFVTGVKALGLGTATPAGVNTLLAHYKIGPITSDFGAGDTGSPSLQAMFNGVPGPLSATADPIEFTFDGRFDFNKWQQNQYFVVTGTGGTVTVTATSARNVDVRAYRVGVIVAADESVATPSNESITFDTELNQPYVVTVTGNAATTGLYDVTVTFKSP